MDGDIQENWGGWEGGSYNLSCLVGKGGIMTNLESTHFLGSKQKVFKS